MAVVIGGRVVPASQQSRQVVRSPGLVRRYGSSARNSTARPREGSRPVLQCFGMRYDGESSATGEGSSTALGAIVLAAAHTSSGAVPAAAAAAACKLRSRESLFYLGQLLVLTSLWTPVTFASPVAICGMQGHTV